VNITSGRRKKNLMSARVPVVPAAVQREAEPEDEKSTQDIANLAYALWQQRGCPEGSPEQDWFEAEKLVGTGPRK
jgi:hypothetical protein